LSLLPFISQRVFRCNKVVLNLWTSSQWCASF
jgi:hypothetical protein